MLDADKKKRKKVVRCELVIQTTEDVKGSDTRERNSRLLHSEILSCFRTLSGVNASQLSMTNPTEEPQH